MEKNTEIIRKKILFRSWHRGTKEMDLVLGTYADNNLSSMSYDELMHFQRFLNLKLQGKRLENCMIMLK